MSTTGDRADTADGLPRRQQVSLHAQMSRRTIVRGGVKLVFVAPVLTTFLASEARAAGSNHSCYPAGHVCRNDGSDPEPCCPGLTCNGNPGTCQ